MKIRDIKIESNLSLGPMAGVTDAAFRRICREYGLELSYSEMVSSRALIYGDKKTKELLEMHDFDRPFGIQLFGSEPKAMARAAEILDRDYDYDILDINMGCPTPKIVKNGDGSALMKNPVLAGEIVSAVRNATNKPVTVKIRLGWDDDSKNYLSFAKHMEESGAEAITVHGRTKEQQYSGIADWDAIGEVKKAVNVPVIGNGDIFTLHDAISKFEDYGVDGIMIARGARGNPFLVRSIADYFRTGNRNEYHPSDEEIAAVMQKHFDYLVEYKGEYRALLEIRKHGGWYLKGRYGGAKLKEKLFKVSSRNEFDTVLAEILDRT